MIKIQLEVTPQQLTAIAAVLSSEAPAPVADKPGPSTAVVDDQQAPPPPAEETTSKAGSLFAESDAAAPSQTTSESAAADVGLAKGLNGQMIPWDVRIHGKAKNKNADGSWRLIQGIDRETLVPQVEAELVAAMSAGKPVQDAGEPSQEQTATTPAADVAQTTTAGDAAPAADTPPPPPASTGRPSTFVELLPLVTTAKANGTLTDEKIAQCCESLGLPNFGMIATRPDLIESAADILGV